VPIAGALVSALMCQPPARYDTVTRSDRMYFLLIPGAAVVPRGEITLQVVAEGYQPMRPVALVAELRARPVRDFPLARATPAFRLLLPLVFK